MNVLDSIKKWSQTVIVIIGIPAILWTQISVINNHIGDDAKHLTAEQQYTITAIIKEGFTYSKAEKAELEKRLTRIEVNLDTHLKQETLTKAELRALIKEVVLEVLLSKGK